MFDLKGNSFKYVVLLFGFFIVVPLFLISIINPEIINNAGNIITGRVTSSLVSIINEPPIIIINDTSYIEGDFINFSNCAYDANGEDVNCTFSEPLDYYEGIWQTIYGDEGNYIIEINASDPSGGFSTKNITLTIFTGRILGTCNVTMDIYDDHNINISWNNTMTPYSGEPYNYSNFSILYNDYLLNGTFNYSTSNNVSGISEAFFYDPFANLTKERYYRVLAWNGSTPFECDITFGKILLDITPDYGGWNYVSSPFLEQNQTRDNFLRTVDDRLDYAYRYNHEEGKFDWYSFRFDVGSGLDEIYDGECVLVQPIDPVEEQVTFVGEIYTNISRNLTMDYGAWNYFGWVAENITRETAFDGYEADIGYVFKYNHDEGKFDWYSFSFGVGQNLDFMPQGTCSLVQPKINLNYTYDVYSS